MKLSAKITAGLAAAITALVSGCQVGVSPGGVEASVAAPQVEVVPPSYVWDGYEYVGEINGGVVYLGPGGVWVTAPGFVLDRFHGWARYHPNWRRTAHPYNRYHRPAPREMRRD